MSEARETILNRIRQTTRREASVANSQQAVAEHIARHQRGPLPAIGESAVEHFVNAAQQAAAEVIRLDHDNRIGQAISSYLEAHGIAKQVVAAPSELLDHISWPAEVTVVHRAAQAQDLVAVSAAFAGIAETGTLALLSGPATPTTLNFLPDNYFCVLRRQDLVLHMEDVWDRIRHTKAGMPRTLNFITGPSRTADVEQTIQLGAHGPRRMVIILLEV
jgi:L-lactate dehydrogenase complex protein LldG